MDTTPGVLIRFQHARKKTWTQEGRNVLQSDGEIPGEKVASVE